MESQNWWSHVKNWWSHVSCARHVTLNIGQSIKIVKLQVIFYKSIFQAVMILTTDYKTWGQYLNWIGTDFWIFAPRSRAMCPQTYIFCYVLPSVRPFIIKLNKAIWSIVIYIEVDETDRTTWLSRTSKVIQGRPFCLSSFVKAFHLQFRQRLPYFHLFVRLQQRWPTPARG